MQTRFQLTLGLMAVIGALLTPSSADAGPIGFTGPMNFVQTGHGSAVSATLARAGVNYTASWAGELDWFWGDANPSTPNIVPEGFASTFYSYCVDITSYLRDPQTVTVKSSNGFTNGVADGGAKAAWLFNAFAEGIRNNVSNLTITQLNTRAAALQVAIWEAMYDTVGSVTGGNFRLATTGAVRTQAQAYVNALYAAYGTYGVSAWTSSTALILDTNSGQDQVTRNVPETSTLLATGLGFFLIAGLARRRVRVNH